MPLPLQQQLGRPARSCVPLSFQDAHLLARHRICGPPIWLAAMTASQTSGFVLGARHCQVTQPCDGRRIATVWVIPHRHRPNKSDGVYRHFDGNFDEH
jgi:hypothetical protein